MRTSTYQIEPHAAWKRGCEGQDIVVAETDLDALRQARKRVAAGDVYRITQPAPDRSSATDRRARVGSFGLLFVARFFAWEFR